MSDANFDKVFKPKKALPVINGFAQKGVPSALNPLIFAPPQTKERQDALQNRERILEAARRLFSQRGVESVTMAEIADEAGVGVGTIYRRFVHKGMLCQALMENATIAFQQEVINGFGEEGRRATPAGRLRLFLSRLIDFTEAHTALLNASFEADTEKFGVSLYAHAAYDWLHITLVVLLKEAVTSGECRPDLDTDYIAYAVLSPLQINLYLYLRQERDFDVARIKTGLEQLLDGIFVTHSITSTFL